MGYSYPGLNKRALGRSYFDGAGLHCSSGAMPPDRVQAAHLAAFGLPTTQRNGGHTGPQLRGGRLDAVDFRAKEKLQ